MDLHVEVYGFLGQSRFLHSHISKIILSNNLKTIRKTNQKCVCMFEWAGVSVNSTFVSKNICKVHISAGWNVIINIQIIICNVQSSHALCKSMCVFCSRYRIVSVRNRKHMASLCLILSGSGVNLGHLMGRIFFCL